MWGLLVSPRNFSRSFFSLGLFIFKVVFLALCSKADPQSCRTRRFHGHVLQSCTSFLIPIFSSSAGVPRKWRPWQWGAQDVVILSGHCVFPKEIQARDWTRVGLAPEGELELGERGSRLDSPLIDPAVVKKSDVYSLSEWLYWICFFSVFIFYVSTKVLEVVVAPSYTCVVILCFLFVPSPAALPGLPPSFQLFRQSLLLSDHKYSNIPFITSSMKTFLLSHHSLSSFLSYTHICKHTCTYIWNCRSRLCM